MPGPSSVSSALGSLRAGVSRLATLIVVASATSTFAGTEFTRCDPLMLRAQESALRVPARDSGFTRSSGADASRARIATPMRPTDGPGRSPPSANWRVLEPVELGSATSNLMVDTPRDRLVLFGAYSWYRLTNLVWTRPLSDDHAEWVRIEVPGPHPGRYTAPTAVYDSARERLIALGGYPGDGVWALTLTGEPAWTRLADVNAGPGAEMNGTVAIYDPVGDRVVVVTGGARARFEVWSFSLRDDTGWAQLAPAGETPSPRENYHAVYDPLRQRMLLFAGQGGTADIRALSLGDSLAWESVPTTGEPAPNIFQGAAAFDPVHDRFVVTNGIRVEAPSGATDETWVLQFGGVPTWRRFLPAVRPIARNGPCMAYDRGRDRFVMFGGGVGDTWSLSIGADTAWTFMQPEVPDPYKLYGAGLLHDASRQRLLRFGGHAHGFVKGNMYSFESNDLWGLRTDPLERWSLARNGPLPGMAGMSFLFDPGADRLITLGGHSLQTGEWGTSWSLDLADTAGWLPLAAAGPAPQARTLQAAVSDPVGRRIVLFGGRATDGALGDGWLLDLHDPPTWTQMDSTGLVPSPRYGHAMVYDPGGERVLLFGGRDDTGHIDPVTWQLTLAGIPTWSRLLLPHSPSPRSHAVMVLDPLRHRLVLFGGLGADSLPLHDTWYLPLAPRTDWVMADTFVTLPRERWAAAAAFDRDHDRMVVLAGTYDPCSYENVVVGDDWEMRSSDRVLAPLVLTALERHPQSIAIAWQTDAFASFAGTVERRTVDSPWQMLGPVDLAEGGGAVRFEDTTVVPGARYAYRVRWSEDASANASEPIWTDVPALRLSLDRVPNPVVNGLRVSFSLPDGAPARLDLLDVTGRTIRTREVGDLGVGDHTLQWLAPGALVPGRYWVRLRRGDRAHTAGVVVLR